MEKVIEPRKWILMDFAITNFIFAIEVSQTWTDLILGTMSSTKYQVDEKTTESFCSAFFPLLLCMTFHTHNDRSALDIHPPAHSWLRYLRSLVELCSGGWRNSSGLTQTCLRNEIVNGYYAIVIVNARKSIHVVLDLLTCCDRLFQKWQSAQSFFLRVTLLLNLLFAYHNSKSEKCVLQIPRIS